MTVTLTPRRNRAKWARKRTEFDPSNDAAPVPAPKAPPVRESVNNMRKRIEAAVEKLREVIVDADRMWFCPDLNDAERDVLRDGALHIELKIIEPTRKLAR